MSLRASAHTGVAIRTVPLVPPWLPLWGSCHEVTERVKTLFPPLRGTSPKGKAGVRIVIGGNSWKGSLVRNDILF